MISFRSRLLITVGTCLLSLTACDKEKIPLTGERESFITLSTRLQPDANLANQVVSVPAAVVLTEWPQNAGNTLHSLPPLTLDLNPTLQWQTSMGRGVTDYQRLLSGIVIAQNVVYAIDSAGTVTALSLNEKQPKILWQQSTEAEHITGDALGGGVATEGGKVFVTSSFAEVLALDSKDGKILWRSSASGPIRSAPTCKDGRVFVTTISNETIAYDANTGKQLWTHAGITEQASLLGGASPAVSDNVVIVAYSSGEIYALQAENGQVLWSDTLTSAVRIDTVSSIPHIHAAPVVEGGKVFAVSHGGKMIAIDLKTGVREWQREIGGLHAPAVAGSWLFILSNHGDVFCLQKDTGAIRWVAALPKSSADDKESIYWAGPIIANDQLVFAGSNGQVQFVNVADGKPAKTLSFSGQTFLSPVIVNKTLFILNDQAELYAWQ
ncbi:PQQ-binding-like beta-propeller repeat protein [Candidatus Finniella inopinata]|uniref:Pyrrolo-quinoline quinone n=1 Tax=Candidatus Finniella inopinata TaxID=1696036 RepID=A0A4Q7DKA9_9PROT|nr:PQQ-binding-like beta-propeller repeat protein [Candidatus Finniella inopinata]RZI46504.1 pyrrolo-quinoline quinone [Candidatus Finniella inopinata]